MVLLLIKEKAKEKCMLFINLRSEAGYSSQERKCSLQVKQGWDAEEEEDPTWEAEGVHSAGDIILSMQAL